MRSRIREIKHGKNDCTGTVLLVGIPNVGKSAIVNAMHQIGRIGAAGDICRLLIAALLFVLHLLWFCSGYFIPMIAVGTEKGKLKHAIVSSHPGETRDIIGYKVL